MGHGKNIILGGMLELKTKGLWFGVRGGGKPWYPRKAKCELFLLLLLLLLQKKRET